MGAILDYIENNNQVNVHCYKTRKLTLDDADYESITSENSDTDTIPMDTSGRIAEDDTRRVHTVRISRHLIETMQPWFTYFLDGSRHTYKVDDISIGSKIKLQVQSLILQVLIYEQLEQEFLRFL